MPGPISPSSRLDARWQADSIHLLARNKSASANKGGQSAIIIAAIVALVLCACLGVYFFLRVLRARGAQPTYLPGAWLKSKWWAWTPSVSKRSQFSSLPMDGTAAASRSRNSSHADTLDVSHRTGTRDSASGATQSGNASTHEGDTAVDRHQSVRSIMTLPAYTPSARPTEQIIGREGERAGVDRVVEFPETLDEEEARRNEEMEALFQIRQARREERAAREERRRLRAEARARGDRAALEELREQSRQHRSRADSSALANVADNNLSSEALIREHRSQERGRRVSSVSYMDLGVARHDGSRVRADSGDSDRRPLMDSAAQMGGTSGRDRSGSHTLDAPAAATATGRPRNVSSSSLSRFMTPDVSDDERSSFDFEMVPTPPPPPCLRNSSAEPPPARDTADARTSPPQYDELSPIADADEHAASGPRGDEELGEAPAYESPTTTGAPRIPGFARLPSIQVTPFSPVSASPGERDWPAAGEGAAGSTSASGPAT